MKNRLDIFFLCLISGIFFGPVLMYAQHTPVDQCATMEQDAISRARFPQRGTLEEFENAIQRKIAEIKARNAQGRTMSGILSLPIIVHVVHNGEPVGSGTNISQAQVEAQIEVLNEDFRREFGTPGYNSHPAGADIEIEFCLSPVDEDGNAMAEPGIHRYNGNRADWTQAQIENQLKPTTIWNPNLFYNIWTVKFAALNANLLGYAQFPDQSGLPGLPTNGPASTDGVVVRYQSFGSVDKGTFPVMVAPFNKGRTLSHETGHWLGLRHIWGDGVCADDFVADTPPAHNSNSGCPTKLSCDNINNEMVQNYMDYTNDVCMNIFTQGQKVRMLAVMELSPRRKTLDDANLCSPIVADVPTANFSSDKQLVLLGGEARFTDLSSNFPNQWNWIFEGGDPNTSTERNPRVTYAIPGTYKATLVATNSLGPSVPLEIDDYITVSEEGLCATTSNFEPSFTPTIIPLSDFGNYSGYLTGHNSVQSKAISEFFANALGYEFISGVKIHFAQIYSMDEDASVTVTVWNARGPQNAPGSVIEKKIVLLKQIQEDLDNNQPTLIVFDRETPVFNRPYQVGIELNYSDGDTVVIQSSANGEAVSATSWIQDQSGFWSPYAIAWGANIAMNIQPLIGMNPSVQVSASKQLIYPGEEVVLNGKGASIFQWNANDGSVEDFTGPQLIVSPAQTTTYLTVGSGLELCNDSTFTTIYIRDDITGVGEDPSLTGISVYPNPGKGIMVVRMKNQHHGAVKVSIQSVIGQTVNLEAETIKNNDDHELAIETGLLAPGLYLVRVSCAGKNKILKWAKQ